MNRETSIYLDLVRIIAAFAVFFGHAYVFTEHHFSFLRGQAGEAVAAFFVLSGFVISYVAGRGESTAKAFAFARAVRIYSVVIPALIATLLFDHWGSAASPASYEALPFYGQQPLAIALLRSLTFTNENWGSHVTVGTNEPFWSLGFEVWYYALFGAFVFARNWPARIFLTTLLLLLAGPKIAVYFGMWLMGVAAFKVVARMRHESVFPKWAWWVIYLATPVCYVLVRFAPAVGRMGIHGKPIFEPFEWSAAMAGSIVYFYAIGVIVVVNIIAFNALSSTTLITRCAKHLERPIRWIAGGTFTLYLVHMPILIAMAAVIPGSHASSVWAGCVAAATLACIALIAEIGERRKKLWAAMLSISALRVPFKASPGGE